MAARWALLTLPVGLACVFLPLGGTLESSASEAPGLPLAVVAESALLASFDAGAGDFFFAEAAAASIWAAASSIELLRFFFLLELFVLDEEFFLDLFLLLAFVMAVLFLAEPVFFLALLGLPFLPPEPMLLFFSSSRALLVLSSTSLLAAELCLPEDSEALCVSLSRLDSELSEEAEEVLFCSEESEPCELSVSWFPKPVESSPSLEPAESSRLELSPPLLVARCNSIWGSSTLWSELMVERYWLRPE